MDMSNPEELDFFKESKELVLTGKQAKKTK